MGRKLPELKRGDALRLVKDFSADMQQKGDIVTGHARDGRSFTIHFDHGKGLTQQQLSRALKYLGVARDEFYDWHG